ncbi:MAG TPA: DedA family protein [Steroidobacteraceae bacterium]|nr:DedA family protein [Steroidobacteraceae bacterium]
METLHWAVNFVLHVDRHLVEMLALYGAWIYAVLFLVVFAETGLVVTPFLPGDSLLFAVGALAAIDTRGTLTAPFASLLLATAAILGNTVNYSIGRVIGPAAFSGRYRFLKQEYLQRTEAFFARYGALAVFLSRFMPIIRTFAPFVAGVGRMPAGRFLAYNLAGALCWVLLFIWGGYWFGNIPLVKDNFGLVTIGIIILSLLPVAAMFLRRRGAT